MTYLFVHVLDPVLVGHDVGLDELVLLHQVLDGSQVLAVVVSVEKRLDLAQPEVQILDGCNEGPLPVGLLQLHRLLRGLLGQNLPLLGDGLQAVDDGLLRAGALLAVDLERGR